eukprot:198847_1
MSLILTILFWLYSANATNLLLQSLNLTYPSYSFGGASAFYDQNLYAWNGYECINSSYTSGCTVNSTNRQYKLNISNISITANREIIVPSTSWQSSVSTQPIDNSYPWPVMITGTGTSSYTYLNNYGWILFPDSGAFRTRLALKYDLTKGKYVNFTNYNAIIPTVSNKLWSGACNTHDAINLFIYAIGGRGKDNYEQSNHVYKYDIQNDKWQQLSNLLKAVFNPSCAVVNEILYSLGGQSGAGMDSRISSISAYTENKWHKVGELNIARHNAISFTHPNNWIITIGGDDKSDNPAAIIEIFDPFSKHSFDTNMRFTRRRFYQAQYIYNINTQILFLWGGVNMFSNVVYNDIQYIILSTNDAIYPTSTPTTAPSMSPTVSPTHYPTLSPSHSPTMSPIIAPPVTKLSNVNTQYIILSMILVMIILCIVVKSVYQLFCVKDTSIRMLLSVKLIAIGQMIAFLMCYFFWIIWLLTDYILFNILQYLMFAIGWILFYLFMVRKLYFTFKDSMYKMSKKHICAHVFITITIPIWYSSITILNQIFTGAIELYLWLSALGLIIIFVALLLLIISFNRNLFLCYVNHTGLNSQKTSILSVITKQTLLGSINISVGVFFIFAICILNFLSKEPKDLSWILYEWFLGSLIIINLLCVYFGFKMNENEYHKICGCCHSKLMIFCRNVANREINDNRLKQSLIIQDSDL